MIYRDKLEDSELKAYASSINGRARTARKKGTISATTLRDRIFASGGKCEWCGTSIVQQPFEVDHIISLHAGGNNTAKNLAVACPDCNRAKSSKHPARFAQEIASKHGISPLIERVINHYGTEALIQLSLFDEEEAPIIPSAKEGDDPLDPPPYIWGKS